MTYRILGVGAIVVCLVSISAVILAVALKGGITTNGPSIASLVAFLGLLTTSLVTVLSVTNVQTKLNGHIAKHEQAVEAAEAAAEKAGSVSEQLARAQDILDQIHVDTNSSYAEMRREVADGRREVADMRAEMERLRAEVKDRPSPPA